MMRFLAILWLMVVMFACGYLALRAYQGLNFSTDLMALLPQEEQNPAQKHTNDVALHALSRHVVILVGDKDKSAARAASAEIARQLTVSGLLNMTTNSFDKAQLEQMGKFYYPYRAGLLSDEDRNLLKADEGRQIAARALSQVYGITGLANAKLLHSDPFLLLPSFLTNLPIPLSRLSLNDGMLFVQDNGMTWVLVAGQLKGEAFALDTQKQVSDVFGHAVDSQRKIYPNLEILHLGAVFFAKAGAEQAMNETSTIGIISILGTIFLIIIMFRAVRPLILSLIVIGVGIVTALSASLFIFGELHVGALLFGITLIGVSVDYSLQYCSEVFAHLPGAPSERLKRVWIGITIGTATTVIGYLTLYLAPFPGLHQIAAFSAVGLVAAWLTVVLWLPLLDRKNVSSPDHVALMVAKKFLDFWERPQYRKLRMILLGLIIILGAVGFTYFHIDDNVRRMQSLSSGLVAEQEKIQKLTGTTTSNQFFLVQAHDNETALRNEEILTERLRPLLTSGAFAGFQSPAQYIPSIARQKENRILQLKYLYRPLLAEQTAQLNLMQQPIMPDKNSSFLTLIDASNLKTPPVFLQTLLLKQSGDEVAHMITLDGVTDPDAVAEAAKGVDGIRLVDPAGDFSYLLGKYRSRAIALLALSAALMAPILIWRYGFKKGLWVLVPPLLAVTLTPALRCLAGGTFTFFDAMGLVLILSIGVDYAVFCAETSEERKAVTMLAVTMAAATALLSFGLLIFSKVSAVHNFGATMTVGILLSFLFAPMARMASKTGSKLIIRNIFMLALGLFFCGCANEAPSVSVVQGPVQIGPHLSFAMPSPSDIGRSINVTQLVTAHYGEQSFAFEAHISATPDHFLLVGLDLMGRKLMSIDWTQDGVSYDTAFWVPAQLRPENVLGDVVLLYWPEAVIRKSLAGTSGKLLVSANSRIIMQDNKKIWQASYHLKSKNDPWNGELHYRNLAWGYDFDVQSAENSP